VACDSGKSVRKVTTAKQFSCSSYIICMAQKLVRLENTRQ